MQDRANFEDGKRLRGGGRRAKDVRYNKLTMWLWGCSLPIYQDQYKDQQRQ